MGDMKKITCNALQNYRNFLQSVFCILQKPQYTCDHEIWSLNVSLQDRKQQFTKHKKQTFLYDSFAVQGVVWVPLFSGRAKVLWAIGPEFESRMEHVFFLAVACFFFRRIRHFNWGGEDNFTLFYHTPPIKVIIIN